VAVDVARRGENDTYTYAVPEGLTAQPGQRAWVPFGRRLQPGLVVSTSSEPPDLKAVKQIERVEDAPLLWPHQVELAQRVAEHYWAPLIDVLRAMVPPRIRRGRSNGSGFSSRQVRHSRLLLHALPQGPPEPAPALNRAQIDALEQIATHQRVLLHGVTGSGKTEVYACAARAALDLGLDVLVLLPEISLSPQLVERLSRRLGVPLAVLHSGLSELERAQQWWRIRRAEVQVVVGSRSAVFAPLHRPGLIVVDEEGSAAYKQDRTPRYEAGWVAEQLALICSARLILGSATPSVASFHRARSGDLALASMDRRAAGRPPVIELVDMRATDSGPAPISRRLGQVVEGTLAAGEQAVLFLNRRGMSTAILCRDCGTRFSCPNCSVAMVQHPELDGLYCHYCGWREDMPKVCPVCAGRRLKGMGVGTQRLQAAVARRWPRARVLRLDSDVTRLPEAYLEVMESFAQGRADILVGTQLVARGLDLEAVSAVGVIDADLPLQVPDYRAAESTFALVTQVAGRAGRGERAAQVVVQTCNPEHYALRWAAAGDYAAFFAQEIRSRLRFGFPPASELAVVTFSDPDPERAEQGARTGTDALAAGMARQGLAGIQLSGPSPAFIHRLRGEWRWQLTIRGEGLARVRRLVPRGRGWSCDVDPRG